MSLNALFEPITLGRLQLPNRIVMAPLTRARADANGVPSPLAASYYSQRAGAGLVIAEATQISAEAQGYSQTPGLHEPAQIARWREVTDAVHAKGGRIFVQLWHTGRASNAAVQPEGRAPKAPSAVRAEAVTWIDGAFAPCSEPVAMTQADINQAMEDFAKASANAIEAGFDGVEIHGANGYLIDQFLRDGANKREDRYGGSIANRMRFLHEVLAAVTARIGADRTGLRLSPNSTGNGMSDSNPGPLFAQVVSSLAPFNLAYLHLIEGITRGTRDGGMAIDWIDLHSRFNGLTIANNGFDAATAAARIRAGQSDLVAFGRDFISNPDLVARLQRGIALSEADASSFYGGGAVGYTDYPNASL